MEIVNHQKKRINWYILHTATVRTEEPMMIDFKPDVEILAVNAAIKAGYHPAGFDLWNPTATEIDDCTYRVKWESAANCN